MISNWQKDLTKCISGEVFFDKKYRLLYATDASAYREIPLGVIFPKCKNDIRVLIEFANKYRFSLIPRASGTSLAGQVVGNGLVVDISKYLNQILSFNPNEKSVWVEPGVVRDELNQFLQPFSLFFAPETSTANRATMGGMVGNNSCGSNSVVYFSTREHLLELKGFLSDGSSFHFSKTDLDAFHEKCALTGLEGKIYSQIRGVLSNVDNQLEIKQNFPKPSIKRRNTGYAIDLLLDTAPFQAGLEDFNFCKLIAGSEGTLAFITEIKLSLEHLPPKHNALVCAHFNSIDESLRANLIALKFAPQACELIDHYVLDCTKDNIEHKQNRFFVEGNPAAILVIEYARDTESALDATCTELIEALKNAELGYHFPTLKGESIKKIWSLRKAGLGLLGNMSGDAKAVPVIEDTAVDVNDLPHYISEFNEILKKYGLFSVHYAHAGSGELHLRPILDLKTKKGQQLFRSIAEEIAILVKKFGGSLSGEHGDGRLRGEFIPKMIGEKNYRILQTIKQTWDPNNIFNPGKIVDTPPMDQFLRYEADKGTKKISTYFNFGNISILQHAEQCNGSGDCRKSHMSGGTMCPSYMATKDEQDTTRARANILREMLSNSSKTNPFDHVEIKQVMDLCLSCKGCKSECPSNVDVAKLKTEFLQQYFDANGIPIRNFLIAHFSTISYFASAFPWLYNFFIGNAFLNFPIRQILGFSTKRTLPKLSTHTLRSLYKKQLKADEKMHVKTIGTVVLFADEFINYNESHIGTTVLNLLYRLGYSVIIPKHKESGRSALSKGLVKKAMAIANQNIELLEPYIKTGIPIVGIEPSAILTLRDEYVDLAKPDLKEKANQLAANVFTIEEFLFNAKKDGILTPSMFTKEKKEILLHIHCHQAALSKTIFSEEILALPQNYSVQLSNAGCCGMAGSFGFEKEHYEVSMKIGSQRLFPVILQFPDKIIAAAGTSCRHQIFDGTGRKALHPAEILLEALV